MFSKNKELSFKKPKKVLFPNIFGLTSGAAGWTLMPGNRTVKRMRRAEMCGRTIGKISYSAIRIWF